MFYQFSWVIWIIISDYLMGNSSLKQCNSCKSKHKTLKQCQCCQHQVCTSCYDYPVIKPQEKEFTLDSIDYYSACKNCFLNKTSLDFSTNIDIIGDNNKKEIIFLHGAGSSRKMFIPHALQLEKRGFRCLLIDLPAHGARYNEDLTLENCIKAIQDAKKLCRSDDITIIGGSLGGYILMEAIGQVKDLCTNAVIMMAGQNVGVNRSAKASFGLWAMDKMAGLFSQAFFAKQFMKAASSNKHLDPKFIEDLAKSGVFFRHSEQNITLLRETNPEESLKKGNVKCLFINGSQDHRDSENIWLQSAGKGSELIVYEGADHFFSHDTRFFNRLITDIEKFISKQTK